MYVARTRNGFTLASRRGLLERFGALEIPECPYVNRNSGRADALVFFPVVAFEAEVQCGTTF